MFHSKDFSSFSICDVLSKNCDFSSNLKQKKINKLLSQSIKFKKDDKNFELNYTSRTNENKNSMWYNEFYKKNYFKKKKIKIDEKLNFFVIGDIEYNVSYEFKSIFYKNAYSKCRRR